MKINQSFAIDGKCISTSRPPFIIAEISANHNGSIDNALQLISLAKQSGADAVKLQTYTPNTITVDSQRNEFYIKDGKWAGQSLYNLYQNAHTPWDWHEELFAFAKQIGITIFSSPFDFTAIDFLEKLECPAYKIASFEIVDIPLIKYAAKTGKPLIISTGMANEEEISDAVKAAKDAGCKALALLHCVSGYPTPSEEYNLLTIPDLIKKYKINIGLSDHTIDNIAAITSVALGATLIEKHFTLDREGGGPDDSFSLEPSDLRDLVNGTRNAWKAMGKTDYSLKKSEEKSIKHRRSLYFIKELRAGDKVTPDSIKSIRPSNGIPPKYYDYIINEKLVCDVKKNSPVEFRYFKKTIKDKC